MSKKLAPHRVDHTPTESIIETTPDLRAVAIADIAKALTDSAMTEQQIARLHGQILHTISTTARQARTPR